MKKFGFTLAEVLLTLAIIGVTAALTAPTLVKQSTSSKIGPRLQKAVATFETAVETMLVDEDATRIKSVAGSAAALGTKLSNYMKITANGTGGDDVKKYDGTKADGLKSFSRYDSSDGISYLINFSKDVNRDFGKLPHQEAIGDVVIATDGYGVGDQIIGKNLFRFRLYNDGSLRPWGQKKYSSDAKNDTLWTSACKDDGTVTGEGWSCTGSIFDHGLKVKYR